MIIICLNFCLRKFCNYRLPNHEITMIAIAHQAYFGVLAYNFTMWWKWIIVEMSGELLQLLIVIVLREPV